VTLDELKRLRERLNDANYSILAETCRVLLDREIERESPLDGPFVQRTRAAWIPPSLRGQSADAEIARLKSEGVEDLIRQRDEARREAAARAKTITRMGEDGVVGAAECSRHREEIARMTKERDAAYTELKRCITARDALKAALDEERKACDCVAEWLRNAPIRTRHADAWLVTFDARRSASRAKEGA